MVSIKHLVNRIMRGMSLIDHPSGRFKFYQTGFHGDLYLLELVDVIARSCDYFIETGTNAGSTLAYMARTYPDMSCISCEPDRKAFQCAKRNTQGLPNVRIYNEISQNFIKRIEREYPQILREDVLFYLDAHGYGFEWPLREEIGFITTMCHSAFVLIDDFKVPELDCFGYDEYEGQICSFDYIEDVLAPGLRYNVYYPSYTKRTSVHHPLRGWGLLDVGHHDELNLPESLQDKLRSEQRERDHR